MDLRFPWLAHALAPSLLVLWYLAVSALGYGVTTDGSWWPHGLEGVMVGLVAAVLLVLGLPAALLEAALLRLCAARWPAWLAAVLPTLPAFFLSHFVPAFRLAGDDSPVRVDLLVFGAVTLAAMVLGQAMAARWLAGRLRWTPVDGRRALARLGLVEA